MEEQMKNVFLAQFKNLETGARFIQIRVVPADDGGGVVSDGHIYEKTAGDAAVSCADGHRRSFDPDAVVVHFCR